MQYDPFQLKAIEHIENGHSVIVSAPTGAGKTVIAEYVINDCLAKSKKLVYTAPIKALSNQKFREFDQGFKGKIGILTGDVSINADAPVLIMTTEIFRNKLIEEKESLNDYSWVIFDEIHYLDDYERGTVWEESIIFLPEHMNILALSATIPNVGELARWISMVHKKPLQTVIEEKRPVPLHFFYQCQGEFVDNIHELKRTAYKSSNFYSYKGRRFYKDEHLRPNKPSSLIKHLKDSDRLPCIYFSFSRKRCEYLAEEISYMDFLADEERAKITSLYDSLCDRFDLKGEKSALELAVFIKKGIAYHHAGMLPTLKEVVEQLFTSRLIKVIFTTETFALGINMPARTVVFDDLRKFYGQYHAALKTRDFYQMAGRAGRRGIDTEGFVYSRVNPHMLLFDDLHRIVYGSPEKVISRFNLSYATVLNLYTKYKESLYDIYPSSFHYFQENQRSRKKAVEILRTKVKLLKELGYIKNNELTPKGAFASRVYGYELMLSELYARNTLEYLSETELAILAIACVYEPRKNITPGKLSKSARSLQNMTEEIIGSVHRREKKAGIRPLSKRYHFHLAAATEAWLQNSAFSNILKYTETDEGEVIRYFRMGIQILREIMKTPASHIMKDKIRKAIEKMNRDVVDAEKELRS